MLCGLGAFFGKGCTDPMLDEGVLCCGFQEEAFVLPLAAYFCEQDGGGNRDVKALYDACGGDGKGGVGMFKGGVGEAVGFAAYGENKFMMGGEVEVI